MKFFKVLFTLIGCAIIVLGAWSAVNFLLQRDFAPEEEEVLTETPVEEEPAPEPEPVEPEEEEPELSPEEAAQAERLARAEELLADMSLEEKIYQLMFLAPEAITGVPNVTQAGDATAAALEMYPVGGIYYGQVNMVGPEQAEALTSNTLALVEEAGGIAPFMGIYEDGCLISPVMGYLEAEQAAGFAEVGAGGNAGEATQMAVEIAETLTDYHFTANFASGIELFDSPNAFGTDGEEVATMITSYVEGLQSMNVAAVLGHFPGEGSALDGRCDKTKDELLASDTLPFIAGIEADAAMIQVSNMTASELDLIPCCLSKAVITDLLRTELGYDGIIITDPLGGVTISNQYDPNAAAVMALEAGADMLYGLTDPAAAYAEIETALNDGDITEERIDESVLRILTAKLKFGIVE